MIIAAAGASARAVVQDSGHREPAFIRVHISDVGHKTAKIQLAKFNGRFNLLQIP
jgi:hypothetical protein